MPPEKVPPLPLPPSVEAPADDDAWELLSPLDPPVLELPPVLVPTLEFPPEGTPPALELPATPVPPVPDWLESEPPFVMVVDEQPVATIQAQPTTTCVRRYVTICFLVVIDCQVTGPYGQSMQPR